MNNVNQLLDIANSQKNCCQRNYYVPKVWNSFGFENFETDEKRPNEIKVNPYEFFAACVESIKNHSCEQHNQAQPNVCENTIYGILPRTYTTWQHGCDGKFHQGTLFKTIMILQMLKKYNVSILYLLPAFKTGKSFKKGDLSSPYAIRDVYKIDTDLHDELLGTFTDELLKIEFKAFIEACHALGMKVMVDFAFRTVSRDNVLIEQHPDWFYWIKKEFKDNFKPPIIGNGEKVQYVNPTTIRQLYKSPGLSQYLSQFSSPPNEIDPEKWERVKSSSSDDLCERIEREFEIVTVPGFPDVINDKQPAWSDVTYLKYYYDNYPPVQKHLPDGQPPYIMQDGASLSTFHGEIKNQQLWDYVTDVLPYYKKEYGIDGARIDMAHAMPAELNAEIIRKIRDISTDFLLWSEELNPEKGGLAKKDGFDFISGLTYNVYKEIGSSEFNKKIFENCYLCSELPLVASLETPDTPRSALKHTNTAALKMLLLLNGFMPNSIPFLNCGQELLEVQPMNLGLDNDENGRFVLPKDDPMYGKLAFFDTYCLHWNNRSDRMSQTLFDIMKIRSRYQELLSNKYFITQPELYHNKKLTALCYYDPEKASGLFIAANRSETSRAVINLVKLLPVEVSPYVTATVVYGIDGMCKEIVPTGKGFFLEPCEVDIIEFKKL